MSYLPVLHLKATGLHNMTVSNDPCETTVTLYTFLRSTPTPAERDAAFHAFLDALHTAPSSGRGAFTRKPNHQLVQLLTSVAVDDVFRSSPHVMPPLARHSDQWVRRLGYSVGVSSSPSAPASSSPLPTSSAASPPRQQEQEKEEVVRAAETRHYRDPYSDYEDHYARQREPRGEAGPHSFNGDEEDHRSTARPLGGEQGEEPLQYSGSTQPPEDARELSTLQEQQQQQKNQYRSYLSAEVSALTNADSGDLHDDDDYDNRSGKSSGDFSSRDGTPRQRVESAGLTTTTSGGLHPVLELITRQVEQAVANPSGGTMSAQRSSPPSPSSSLDQLIKGKILALTSRLDDVAEEVSDDMHTREAEEQAWTPAYSRLKTTMSFVEGLQARLGSAISLYQLQRYERETLQQARVAVQMEALSLQLILRDVRVRLEDAEEAPGGLSAEERELVAALREVLRAPEDSNGEAE